jgi:hypothetical protein
LFIRKLVLTVFKVDFANFKHCFSRSVRPECRIPCGVRGIKAEYLLKYFKGDIPLVHFAAQNTRGDRVLLLFFIINFLILYFSQRTITLRILELYIRKILRILWLNNRLF